MTIPQIIILIIIGAVAGWLGGLFIKNKLGSLVTIIVGIVGSFLGGWLLVDVLGLKLTNVSIISSGDWQLGLDSIICAFAGVLILLVALRFLKKA